MKMKRFVKKLDECFLKECEWVPITDTMDVVYNGKFFILRHIWASQKILIRFDNFVPVSLYGDEKVHLTFENHTVTVINFGVVKIL